MSKHSIFFCISIALLFLCNKNNDLSIQKTWLTVNSERFSSGSVLSLEGKIFHFKNDSCLIPNFKFKDSIKTIKYHTVNDSIYLNDTTKFGRIEYLSNDSLIIRFRQMEHTLVAIDNFHINSSSKKIASLLTGNAWILEHDEKLYPIHFHDKGFYHKEDIMKVCIKHCSFEDDFFCESELERWMIGEYNKNFFIIISDKQFDLRWYQIVELSETNIQSKELTFQSDRLNHFNCIDLIETSRLDSIRNNICSKLWSIMDFELAKFIDTTANDIDYDEIEWV